MLLLLFNQPTRVNVDRVLLPLDILIDATGGPTSSTSILRSVGGVEDRKANFFILPRQYTISFGPDQVDDVLALFRCQLGARYGFMARDPTDYITEDETLEQEVSNDITICQLRKTYTVTDHFTNDVVRTRTRDILLPDPDTLIISINGTPAATGDYELIDGGQVVFQTTYPSGTTITCDYVEDFVPVRFADDSLELTMHVRDVTSIQQTRLIELLPPS